MGIYSLFHPPVFQGRHKKRSYFEGWYFKMAEGREGNVLALIPGVAFGNSRQDQHAFIQVISNQAQKSWYIPFSISSFKASKKELDIEIAGNRFSTNKISVDIAYQDLTIRGEVKHTQVHPFPVTIISPGIMGWYAYLPFMECFHGVVSTSHTLGGKMEVNNRLINFTGGTGYIEKDWGRSFPESWIWMQSNYFSSGNVSCMLSIAKIPFLGTVFKGFLGFIQLGEELIRFGTYTGANILTQEQDKERALIVIRHKDYTLKFLAELGPASRLTAPRQGKMDRKILESIMGSITITISRKDGTIVFHETGTMAGIEMSESGELNLL